VPPRVGPSAHGAQQNVVAPVGTALPDGAPPPGVQDPPEGVERVAFRDPTAGFPERAVQLPLPTVPTSLLQEESEYNVTLAVQLAPLGPPQLHAVQLRPSFNPL
jgi:hypothetical protein